MKTGNYLILLLSMIGITTNLMAKAVENFVGDVALEPIGCQKLKKCNTTNDLQFRDPSGVVWYAPKGTETDGASFPESLEPVIVKIVGDRYDPVIMKAVVLHDHYFKEPVRTWYQTNRMFYDALLESGVDKVRAKLMYSGVLVGSKIWVISKPGKPCPPSPWGGMCTFKTPLDFNEVITYEGELPATSQKYSDNFNELASLINQNEDVSLEELEQKALELRPNVNNGLQQKKLPANGILE